MANILTATVTIVGTRPLLWNRFGPDTIPVGGRRERSGVAGNDPDEWKRSVRITVENQLYLDPTAIFGCLRDAARYTPRKRGTLQPFVAATLQVLDAQVLVNRFLPDQPSTDSTQPVYLDIRSVRNPATRARNVRYRVAAASGWQTTFSIHWNDTISQRCGNHPLMTVIGPQDVAAPAERSQIVQCVRTTARQRRFVINMCCLKQDGRCVAAVRPLAAPAVPFPNLASDCMPEFA